MMFSIKTLRVAGYDVLKSLAISPRRASTETGLADMTVRSARSDLPAGEEM